jgi:DGQHR domain-containing protein
LPVGSCRHAINGDCHRVTFPAVGFAQRPGSPRMYVTAAKANEILEWADAPRASVDLMALYQRALDPKRAPELTQFFKADSMNIVPGAIIIATAPGALRVEPSNDEDRDPIPCKVTISALEQSAEATLKSALNILLGRLSGPEKDAVEQIEQSPEEVQEEIEEFEESTTSDADAGLPTSYLTVVAADLERASQDWESLDESQRSAIEEYLSYVSKPGLIIDGQHRVYAAKDVNDFDVILPVVIIDSLPMSEQVFHFYVLNNKAKPLTKTELRRTISTALSTDEIDSLWNRLKEAGVDPDKVRLTHLINTDEESPFRGLIDFGLAGDSGFIKENVAYQLVDNFVSMPTRYRALGKDIPVWEAKEDKAARLPAFYAFWAAIKSVYANAWADGVANGGGQFFMKVALLTLQSFILDNLLTLNNLLRKQGKEPPFANLAELADHVASTIEDLPEEFFTREWMEKQIDTVPGRKMLRASIQEVIDAGGKNLGNRTLFKPRA